MRWLLWSGVAIVVACLTAQARAEDIIDVLRSSQQKRLDSFSPAADSARALRVRASFEFLRGSLGPALPAVELRVIDGDTVAETLHGHIVVANEKLGGLPEGERLFVLAHELGHVINHHWLNMGLLYQRWVPGAVTPDTTDPVSEPLSREASALAHRQEFEADAFALRVLRHIGHGSDEAMSAFLHLGMTQATATHPATQKRVAALRAAALEPMDAAE